MKTRLIVLAVAVLAFAVVAMAADDPFVGTWKMNLAKSKFSDPSSAPKSYISSVESLKNGMFKYTLDYVAPDGQAVHFYFNCLRDGKDYPVIGDPDADAVAFTQADPNTTPYIVKKGGKQVKSGRLVVSKDGKTLTQIHTQKNQKGQDTRSTFVFEKQ